MLIILLPPATLDFSTSLVYARRFFFGHLAMYALHLVAKTYVVIFQAVPMHFDLVVHANSALHLRFKLYQRSAFRVCRRRWTRRPQTCYCSTTLTGV